jgi:hypothetical protein
MRVGERLAVVGKVEAAVDPDAAVGDGHVALRVDGPLAWGGDVVVGGHGAGHARGAAERIHTGYMYMLRG